MELLFGLVPKRVRSRFVKRFFVSVCSFVVVPFLRLLTFVHGRAAVLVVNSSLEVAVVAAAAAVFCIIGKDFF